MIGVQATPEGVVVVAMSATQWRVGDAPGLGLDPLLLRGFIVRIGDVFEVSEIGKPRDRRYYSSFDDAVRSFSPPQ